MNNKYELNEKISAFADGELDGSLHDSVLKSLGELENKLVWNDYHSVGDMLRSSETIVPSAEFSARLLAALADEPIHLKSEACLVTSPVSLANPLDKAHGLSRRLAMPGTAIAAAVVLAVSAGFNIFKSPEIIIPPDAPTLASVTPIATVSTIHDAQIDDYLLAHQRFSPSLYTTGHYARSSNSVKE